MLLKICCKSVADVIFFKKEKKIENFREKVYEQSTSCGLFMWVVKTAWPVGIYGASHLRFYRFKLKAKTQTRVTM